METAHKQQQSKGTIRIRSELFLLLDSVRARGACRGGPRLSELCCMPTSICSSSRYHTDQHAAATLIAHLYRVCETLFQTSQTGIARSVSRNDEGRGIRLVSSSKAKWNPRGMQPGPYAALQPLSCTTQGGSEACPVMPAAVALLQLPVQHVEQILTGPGVKTRCSCLALPHSQASNKMHLKRYGQGKCGQGHLMRNVWGEKGSLTCMSLAWSAVEVMASSPAAPSASELSWRTVSADSLSGDLASACGDMPISYSEQNLPSDRTECFDGTDTLLETPAGCDWNKLLMMFAQLVCLDSLPQRQKRSWVWFGRRV